MGTFCKGCGVRRRDLEPCPVCGQQMSGAEEDYLAHRELLNRTVERQQERIEKLDQENLALHAEAGGLIERLQELEAIIREAPCLNQQESGKRCLRHPYCATCHSRWEAYLLPLDNLEGGNDGKDS